MGLFYLTFVLSLSPETEILVDGWMTCYYGRQDLVELSDSGVKTRLIL